MRWQGGQINNCWVGDPISDWPLGNGRLRAEGMIAMEKAAARSTIVDTSLGQVEYIEHGQGAPVLFVHGSPGGSDQCAVMTEFWYRTDSGQSRSPGRGISELH